MKKRVLSALIAFIVLVPMLYIGNVPFVVTVYILSILALKEFLDIKETKKELPFFIKTICYLFLTIVIFSNIDISFETMTLSYPICAGLFLTFLIPTVLFHDRKKYSVNDAFYLMGGVFFLAFSFLLLLNIRQEVHGLELVTYLLLISMITDTYSYFIGSLIGKTTLVESISPHKTWEGLIGGTLFGVFIPVVYYITVINPEINIFTITIITLFLSIIGQFGDLVFSSIKRYFGKKDFSHLMPGHGGLLDRFDSIIFILLGFMFVINFL